MCPSIEHGEISTERRSPPELSLLPLQTERILKRNKEGKEYACQREWREYRDVNDKIICKTMVDIKEEPTQLEADNPELGTYDGHELDALVLTNPETFVTIDVLEHFNPHGVPIIIDSLIEQTGWRHDPREMVIVPPLKSPLEMQYLLHELCGHSEQFRNPVLRPLLIDYYDTSSTTERGKTTEELTPGIAAIKQALHHLVSVPPEEGYKLFDLVEQTTERDAERKSLEAIDTIREKTGIDLLIPFWWEPTKFADTPYWQAAEAENARTAARLSATDKELQNPSFRLKGPSILTITDEISRYLRFLNAVQGRMYGGGDGQYDLEERLGLNNPFVKAA